MRILRGTHVARIAFAAGTAIIALATPSLAHAQVARANFSIPSQDLASALEEFGRQSGKSVMFDPERVSGARSKALVGTMSANEGLKQILIGTGLSVRSVNTNTFLVSATPRTTTAAMSGISFSRDGGAESTVAAQEGNGNGVRGRQPEEAVSEIVVTARHKEEGLTEVPASITSYSSDFLERQNIKNFTDYATKIPNLTFQYGQGADLLWGGTRETTIRGVVGNGTTAYYINDTPVPPSVSPQTLNLDRIEVLKGPQGTLFGASSMGGNFRFITKKPSLGDSSLATEVRAGGTKGGGFDINSNTMANLVLVPERLALNAAFGYTRESGFITRRFPDASGQPVSRDNQGRNDLFTGSLTLRVKFSEALEASIGALGQTSKLTGLPAAYVPLPGYKPLSYTVDRQHDVQEYARDRWGLASFVLNYSGDGFAVVSSTSYFARRIAQREDNSEGTNQYFKQRFEEENLQIDLGDPPIIGDASLSQKNFTEEARLSFDDGAILPGLSGIVGVFYQSERKATRSPPIIVQEMADAGLDPLLAGESVTNIRSSNAAIFGELYYEVIPKLTVTLGLRQYWITRKVGAEVNTGYIYDGGVSVNPALSNKQSGLVPKGVLSYKIGDQGNIYVSAAKGFRTGGSQQLLPDLCSKDFANLGINPNNVGQYGSDTLWSYEVGAKSRLANGRLTASAAAFRMDWTNIQQNTNLPICAFTLTTNAGKASIRGGEMEIAGRPIAHVPLTLQFGLGYTDAVLRDPGLLPQPPNSRLGQVPKWTGTISVQYETPISSNALLYFAADYSYTGPVKVPDGAGGFFTRQPFNLVNANAGLELGRSGNIMIYVNNLFDKRLNFGDQPASGFERQDDSGQRYPRGTVSRPRQIGIRYGIDF